VLTKDVQIYEKKMNKSVLGRNKDYNCNRNRRNRNKKKGKDGKTRGAKTQKKQEKEKRRRRYSIIAQKKE